MNKLASAMHDATHQVPGVPAHSDSPATGRPNQTHVNPRRGNSGPHSQNQSRNHDAPPRVLIAWQNWIGRLFGHGNGRQG
jgi:hypothetical protein